jgi:hypothetical protein
MIGRSRSGGIGIWYRRASSSSDVVRLQRPYINSILNQVLRPIQSFPQLLKAVRIVALDRHPLLHGGQFRQRISRSYLNCYKRSSSRQLFLVLAPGHLRQTETTEKCCCILSSTPRPARPRVSINLPALMKWPAPPKPLDRSQPRARLPDRARPRIVGLPSAIRLGQKR